MTDPTLMLTGFDSASLAGLASIAHPIAQVGVWRLEAYGARGYPTASADILVREGGPPRLSVDLALGLDRTACGDGGASLSPAGMLNLVLNSAREGGYALLHAAGGGDPTWDSRRLVPGDHYACMPLRPGRYDVANGLGTARASVRVTWPPARASAARPQPSAGPAILTVGESIEPSDLTIAPGRVLLFVVQTPARLTLDLRTPDDGPTAR
ncbi:MAG TPA: hypothetical protein VKQ54_14775 [Caulobacteraceae bacterium]|nr:hypothetical protein [Caulobacteraceae bacterium]